MIKISKKTFRLSQVDDSLPKKRVNHAHIWFYRFRSGNSDANASIRCGRPIVAKVNKIMKIVQSDRHGSVKKLDRISTSESLLIRMVNGDIEKWITYGNVNRKRSCSKGSETSQTIFKSGLTDRKVRLARNHPLSVASMRPNS
ncbi:uncharacterized protein LOC110118741 [Ceratitis capitata]|uniref:uncharacterized protein LOC110118741 n=1 Tax=Ceratitis capitata TaxID=7213 RepID=UPI000A11B136|nr:uncharacterized protein LOC110118741 [Ceratitis capitata]